MTNCHKEFGKLDGKISLSSDKKEDLRTSRDALRKKIKKYFEETLNVKAPLFYGQGSYMMNTTINPLDDGEYDIDDGIYLEHMKQFDEEEWKTPATVHNWIVRAVDKHTSAKPINKGTCVRVKYTKSYHVDFPIYVKKDGEAPKLAHLYKGWIESDPKEFTKWFNGQVKEKGDQLKRIVRYLKAWKDYKQGDIKLPSGMVLTVLVANNFVGDYPDRDDAALVATAKGIYDTLSEEFSVKRPISPFEELLEDWSDTKEQNFLTKLNSLVNTGQKALDAASQSNAINEWKRMFGDNFPEGDPEGSKELSKAMKTEAPAIIGNHGRSA
ncbi:MULTISPECIES: CBASS cGAMP synthase [Bacillus cereus group]|uniref:CBASS cGAMP synthase n=1 Tax=Bacillus cereus group TaxID=86661 RepID=UPI0024BD55A1|nr:MULTISPECIES: CBASS cGAMP synthase [Bacillus cereus group]MED3396347.1 CBASS cGAMP synthase [Bacillus wiedmannii]